MILNHIHYIRLSSRNPVLVPDLRCHSGHPKLDTGRHAFLAVIVYIHIHVGNSFKYLTYLHKFTL